MCVMAVSGVHTVCAMMLQIRRMCLDAKEAVLERVGPWGGLRGGLSGGLRGAQVML